MNLIHIWDHFCLWSKIRSLFLSKILSSKGLFDKNASKLQNSLNNINLWDFRREFSDRRRISKMWKCKFISASDSSYDLFSPVFFLSLSLSVCLCLSLSLSVFLLNRDIRTKIQRQQLHTHLMVLGPCGKSNFFSKLKMKGDWKGPLVMEMCTNWWRPTAGCTRWWHSLCKHDTHSAEGVWDQPGTSSTFRIQSLSLVSELDV